MRLTMDTSVVVAAIRSDAGVSRGLLRAGLEQRYTLLLSVPLVVEYEAVLTRPEHLMAAGISLADVGTLLDALVVVAEPVELAYLWRPQLPDPDDDMVLECAVNGRADVLVTFNGRHFKPAARQFRLTVGTPRIALRRVEEEER